MMMKKTRKMTTIVKVRHWITEGRQQTLRYGHQTGGQEQKNAKCEFKGRTSHIYRGACFSYSWERIFFIFSWIADIYCLSQRSSLVFQNKNNLMKMSRALRRFFFNCFCKKADCKGMVEGCVCPPRENGDLGIREQHLHLHLWLTFTFTCVPANRIVIWGLGGMYIYI